MAKAFKWLFGAIVILILGIGVALGWLITTIVSPFSRLVRREEKLSGTSTSDLHYLTDNVKS
jgi:hypothetical protein